MLTNSTLFSQPSAVASRFVSKWMVMAEVARPMKFYAGCSSETVLRRKGHGPNEHATVSPKVLFFDL